MKRKLNRWLALLMAVTMIIISAVYLSGDAIVSDSALKAAKEYFAAEENLEPTAGNTETVHVNPPSKQPPPSEPMEAQQKPIEVEVSLTTDIGYDLTKIATPKVPLANTDIENHECCIFHFIWMFGMLLVTILYAGSMKKRQKRLFELRREYELELSKRNSERQDEGSKRIA